MSSPTVSSPAIYRQVSSKTVKKPLLTWTQSQVDNVLASVNNSLVTVITDKNLISIIGSTVSDIQSVYEQLEGTAIPFAVGDKYKSTGKTIEFTYGTSEPLEIWTLVKKLGTNEHFYIATNSKESVGHVPVKVVKIA